MSQASQSGGSEESSKKDRADTSADVLKKIASLSRLRLSESELTLYSQQIGAILEYVDLLKEVDVSSVRPLSHPHQDRLSVTPLRDDVPRSESSQCGGADAVMACAPRVEQNGFQVPPVL